MSRADRIAILLSLIAVVAAYFIAERIFEQIPHLEDEMAYVWQSKAFARGQLTVPTPPEPKSFLVPFVVDYEGRRFGKYPPGWPALLAIGELVGLRGWINPLLSGLGIWLTYRIGKKILGETVGLLAAGLTITSPLFLMNSGMLLSHPLGLVLTAGFCLSWLNAFWKPDHPRPWISTLIGAVCLGWLAVTRPWTAVAVALPFAAHGLYLLIYSKWSTRRRLIAFILVTLAISALVPVWQKAVTGDFTLNPYTLWWEYDKV
ncbi:MAG TPA: glycosyltransferase family 39 protein, partial [Anaerolineales bacterium]|nr:glycosyltransferase family 39 protein [Anaerolineales bacterium]